MVELGELEKHHADFEKRNTQVFVASSDDLDNSKAVQKDFPHLIVLSDADQKLISSVQVLHLKAGNHRQDVAAPTTFIIDRSGMIRFTHMGYTAKMLDRIRQEIDALLSEEQP